MLIDEEDVGAMVEEQIEVVMRRIPQAKNPKGRSDSKDV